MHAFDKSGWHWFLVAADEKDPWRLMSVQTKQTLRRDGYTDAAIDEYESRPTLHLTSDPNAPRRSFCGLRLADDPLIDEIAQRLIDAANAGKRRDDPDFGEDDPRCDDCLLAVFLSKRIPLSEGGPPPVMS